MMLQQVKELEQSRVAIKIDVVRYISNAIKLLTMALRCQFYSTCIGVVIFYDSGVKNSTSAV